MQVSKIQSLSFKRYIPVQYYVQSEDNPKKYNRVVDPKVMKRCNRFVVSNLNGTAKSNVSDDFVRYYSTFDPDYRKINKVTSLYEDSEARVCLITGLDSTQVEEFAKPIGVAKSASIERTGCSKTSESRNAAKDYFRNVKNFVYNVCKRVTTPNGKAQILKVFLNPVYKKNGDVKNYKFVTAQMHDEIEN